MSYLRIATHPGIFSSPLTPAEALANVDALAALQKQHGVRTLYTRDADFRKLPFLDVRDPFAA
jgi:nicotinamidase-related amidase